MDNNSISNLQEYETLISLSFQKIDKSLKEYGEVDQYQKRVLINVIEREISSVKCFIGLLKMESSNLKEEINIKEWQEKIYNLRSKNDGYKEQLNQMENKDFTRMNELLEQNEISEYLCIDFAPIDYPLNRRRHKIRYKKRHKIKSMFKRCISDKLFLGMICFILLYTIFILILYFFS